jgi:uncharacterized protein YdaU (DUF1376 family)
MNFYPFHVGDYISHTAHLEPMEDLAYRRMIDLYWIRESELPLDPVDVAKLIRLRGELSAINCVLSEFFEKTETGWIHKRCEYEIEEAKCKRIKAKQSIEQRWKNERNTNVKETNTNSNTPNPNPIPNKKQNLSAYPQEFEEIWDSYPKRPGANKNSTYRAWKARATAGVAPAVMLAGTKRYAAYCSSHKTDPNYIKQPSTFFGPDEHYLLPWAAITAAPSVAVSPAKCCVCGDQASKKIMQSWYCQDHDQHTPLPSGLESLSQLFVERAA